MTTCRYTASDTPRVVVGRHTTDCAGETCGGCQPCVEPHCRVCSRAHADGSCAECVAETRDTLHDIAAKCDALPDEVAHRGIDGEAMMLLGPAADPEAWRNRAMSAIMGRLDAAYLEDCRDELHPLWVLGTWEQVWRDHLDQPTDLAATLPRLVDYLDRQMHLMADQPEPPFEDFARDLRRCLAHLEAVLHDQHRGDPANVGCFECGAKIERRLTRSGFEDHWTCTRCRRTYTYAEYNFAL
ncbi:MAG TPA: hypothetical protein VFU14_14050, partial [Acidimicrobiales bacterium]|nr:hypothetical protein [Acidimicrobiales bacterium]